jgi:drug/metabolite transporter (DMT)-like permease
MSGLVVGLVLISALMHAGWNFLVKRGNDGQLDTALFAMGCSLIAAVLLPFVPLPDPSCYPWLLATLFIHVAYFLTLAAAYQHADLSLAYPVMRGLAPVLVSFFALASGEMLNTLQMLGIGLIAFGILMPAWIGKPWKNKKGLYFAVLNAAIIALYTVLDGVGVRLSGNAISYTLWLFLFNSWGILAILIWRRSLIEVVASVRAGWRLALLGAGLSMGSYGIVLWAMTQSAIPAVAALREISVVFAAFLGAWFLKETVGRWRILGASFVGVGAAVIRFS